MARTLADLFTPEEKARFDDTYNRGGITQTTAPLFAEDFASEIDDIAFRIQEIARIRQMPYSPSLARSPEALAEHLNQQEAELKERRSRAFDTALDVSFGTRSMSQLQNLQRAIMTGYADVRFKETLQERGPLGIAEDLAKSLITSVPRGIEATAKTLGGGFGRKPIERIGEMTGALLPIRAGLGLASTLARSAGRPTLAKALGKAVSHPISRGAAWTGETADILGAEEDVYYEGLLEVLGEGTAEGLGAIGRGAKDAIAPPEEDPTAAKQQQRAADNDAAAADRNQRINAGKIQAALEIEADRLTAMMQQAIAGKDQLDPEDIASIDDTMFVEALESQAQHLQPVMAALEELGLENASDMLLATMLAKHQQARNAATPQTPEAETAPETEETTPTQTPEQTAAADLAGQSQEQIDAAAHQSRIDQAAREKEERLQGEKADKDAAVSLQQLWRQKSGLAADDPQNQSIDSEIEELSNEHGLRIVDITGAPYDTGVAAQPLNIDTFESNDELVIDRMIEPIIMKGTELQKTGSVIVKKKGETPDEQPTTESTDTPEETATGTGEQTAESTETPPEEPEVDWAGLEADIGSEILETMEREGHSDVETVVDNAISALVSNRTITAAAGERLKTTVIEQITPVLDEIRQRQEAETEVPETRVGTETVGFESDGTTEHRVRPVLRELDAVVPSHDLAGEQRPDYPDDLQPREARGGMISMEQVRQTASQPNFAWLLEFPKQFRDGPPLTSQKNPRRVVSGNGRTLALTLMRENYPENWEGYQEALRAELEKVGIDPAEADAMENPVLTYELLDNTDEVALASDANTQATLDNTAAEQAGQDADYFDDEIMALWQPGSGDFTESLKSEANQPFRTALFNRIPTNLVSGFMTVDNRNFSNDGIQRIQNAMIRYVFGGDIGGQLAKTFIEEGLEDTKNIESMLRNSIATLAYAKANGQDIGAELASAIFRFIEFNQRADKDTRRIPKEVLLYAEIEGFYRTPAMLEPVPLLEKQLLYLIYAKRNAPRQLAEDIQTWARTAITSGETDLFGGSEIATNSESIFPRIIRNHLSETIFGGVDASSMPPELVNLREDIDAIPTAEGKVQAVSDWTDAFLRQMNEGQQQTEREIPDATREPTAPDGDRESRTDSATPARERGDATSGEPTPSDTGTDTGDRRDDTTDDEQRRTDRDADSTPAGEESLTIEESLKIASVGTVSLDEWNASPTTGKRKFLDNQERAIPVHLRTGAINIVEADQKRKAIARLRRDIDETETDTPTSTPDDTPADSQTTPTPTPQESDETIDTNQVVGISRRQTETTTNVSPAIQQALGILGIPTADWEHAKDNEQAEALLMSRQPFETPEQIDASVDLAGDIAGEMTIDEEEDYDFDDDDLFNDVDTGRLRDISDEHRSDFDTLRRKVFLAKTIARLEGKVERTPVETAQLRALTATQRTDAQQEIYDRMLQAFVDQQVKRLEAKPSKSATETRILEALTAVQAEGIPEEASDLSLYADLETPDQEHSRPLSETRTLAGVQAPDTADTELNLPRAVTEDTTKLSPAQRTSVKAIIAAFTRKIHTDTDTTVQGGFLLGDKPGVGKTRQALATIWHYMRNGLQKHFVFAPNQQLINNYTTDMESMGGPTSDLSNYDSGNQKLTTPIGTATYSMLIRKPNLTKSLTTEGNQNAIADIVEHLTGVRPILQQTHPQHYATQRQAFESIGIHNLPGTHATPIIKNAVTELRRQARNVNLDNPEHVENFRRRVTPALAEMLLSESTQTKIFTGSELHEAVAEILGFAQTHLDATPDPDFAEKAEQFEGVIVLDEMHKAAGLNSQTGRMIDTLHRLLPNARFLYMSATPFKEIDNFLIAQRLGLWGANQPFPTFSHFRQAFKRATRAIKEVVPLHLKQIGRYVSRALSSKETRYTPREVPLTDIEKQQYDTAVTLVKAIEQRFEASIDNAKRTSWGNILDSSGAFHLYRAKYMRMFYGATQNFFLALLDAMKAQGLEAGIKQQLANNDKIIVQLENTWKKSMDRAQARGKTGTIGPFDLLIDFIESENMFPVHAHTVETRTKNDGTPYDVVVPLMQYENGKQVRVIDSTLKQLQTDFLAMLQNEMQQNPSVGELPFAADVIHQIAYEAGATSGEISGRSQIFPKDNPQQMPQDTNSQIERTKAFSETTDLNLIVLGPAGLTGINLPIMENIKDKVGGLFHYLVQSSWNVNTFEQGLGRGKRSNSAIDPHYMVVYQDLPGADRVLGATLSKFAEMGALAGQADNALMQNIDKAEGETSIEDDPEADVFEEQQGERSHVFGMHGQEALAQLWYDMYQTSDFEVADKLGLTRPEIAGDTGFIDPDTVPTVKEFFQRMLHQTTTDQPQIYEQFESRLKRIVTYKKELGQLDVGANNLNSQNGQITDRLTVYTDPDTGQTAEVVKLDVERQLPRRSWEFLQKVIRRDPGYEHHGGNRFVGVYQDVDGHVWAIFEYPFSERGTIEYIRWGPRGTPVQGVHEGTHRITSDELANDFTLVADENESRLMNMEETQRLWETEDTEADTYVDSEIFMATGLLLPKWQELSPAGRHAEVMGIIPMADGSHLHGRVIPAPAVTQVLQRIGGVDPNYFDAQRRASRDETIADPNIDIPALVREIIGQQTDTQISARLNNIVEHIHQKLPLQLKGHLVRSAAEAALLGQFIRDPQTEHVWIVYRREGRIVKIEPRTLNKKGEAEVGEIEDIQRTITEEGADSILRIHNHPSGVARWSQADKNVALQWHQRLGTVLAEDIIVDSGTYAYRTFENGEYTWHEDIPVNTDWNTETTPTESLSGELRAGDPLYENPLLRGARDAANYMYEIKRRTPEIAELIFVDSQTGKIVDTRTDAEIRLADDPAAHIKNLLSQRQGQHAHVMTWGDTNLAMALDGVENVDSVWVNDTRWTGVEHTVSVDRSITREVGGVEQGFVKAGDTFSGDNLLRDYQPSAEVPRANRAVRAMPPIERLNLQGEGKTRKWMSPQSQLFEKLRLWTPKLRKAKRILDNARRSGYGLLEELKASWDSDTPGPGDVITDMLDHRMHLSQTWTGRTRSILIPVLKKLHAQVKRDGGQDADALRAAVDHDIINFIENNTPLRADFKKYESIATELKESWRKVNQSYVEAMIKLMRDMAHREDIMKFGTRGAERWSPEPLGDLVWSWDVQDSNGESGAFITKDTAEALKNQKQTPGQTQMNLGQTEKTYTIAEAFAETDQLWYPHQYDRSRLRDYNRKVETLINTLNKIVAQGDQASDEDLAKAGIQRSGDGYLHGRLGIQFDNLDAIIDYYVNIRDRTATLIKWYDDGSIGMYPHLERIRETHDRLYRRDTNLLMSTTALLWDRFAEIATFGQIDPYGKLPPRLATVLQTVELFNANERETALMSVIDGLHATTESRITAPDDEQWGMHESIAAFEGGERAAYDIMQMWEDYTIDDEGNKVKTGKWKGIDINRLNLEPQTLGVLEQIGFIQPDGDGGFRVFGKTDAAQQKTIARFFVELMQTKASRKKKIQELVQSLGHWQQKDPLTQDSNELWKRMNTLVSLGALGWKQALQNLTEIPAVIMMAGTKSTMGMIRDMRDPDFKAAASELTEGLKHGVEFLADDNLQEKYLDSAWSMFGWTERTSRMIGVGVGLSHAKNLSRELLSSQEGSQNRGRIEREMRALRMNPEAVLQMPADQLDTVFDEVIQRIKSQELPLGGVELPSTAPAKNQHTDRMGEEWVRSAMFLSDTVFKPYDARTLPSVFGEAGPALKIILKFKGWMLQQNRFMVDQYNRAYQESRRYGNYQPLSRILTSTLILTGSVGSAQMLFSMLQDRDDDDKLLRAFLHTQTLGLSAVLWELALRSEGSPWRLEKSLEGTIVGPVWGTFADMLAPTVTGNLDRTLQEVMQRTPVAREMLYLGANRWWSEEE